MEQAPDPAFLSLVDLAEKLRGKAISPVEITRHMLDRIEKLEPRLHAYALVTAEAALEEARAAESEIMAGRYRGPLHGVPIAVKDLCFTKGVTTACGTTILKDWKPEIDATVVERLRLAGAVSLGKLQMTEAAFADHHPAIQPPLNPWNPAHWSGASSSGSGVATAAGLCFGSLGSDTGGSIRIPAALQGLVGFKNTARLTPAEGAIPLSTSLDTVCAITLSVRDAVLLHEILAQRSVALAGRPIASLRFALPTTVMLDALEPAVAAAFERAVRVLRDAGAQIVERALPSLAEIPALNARGTLAAAESWAWHRALLARRGADYDPRVAQRIRAGESMSAADYIDLLNARRDWIARTEAAIGDVDALLSPTVPIVAPPIAPLVASDEAFFETNARLLRNPSVVNLLDGCALSLPCHAPGEWPVGLMVWHGALHDDSVLGASLAIERVLAQALD